MALDGNRILPPIRYFGGKGNMLNKLIDHFPDTSDYTGFVDVYGGAATVLFAKPYKEIEVYNDLEQNVYALYKVLQDKEMFVRFRDRAQLSVFQERLSDEYFDSIRYGELDLEERAFRFWYVNRTRRGGLGGLTVNTSVRRNMSKSTSDFLSAIDRLDAIHQRLSSVMILNRDALNLIPEWDRKGMLIYADPPYVHEKRGSARYLLDASKEHHEKLIVVLMGIRNAKIALSGYNNDLYNTLSDCGWKRHDFDVNTVSGNNLSKTKVESLWVNY